MKEDLIILADKLDKIGLHKEASNIDSLLHKLAEDYSEAAEESGLSQEALQAITELLFRISRDPECIAKINELGADGHIDEEELLQIFELGCVEDDTSGISEEYARRTERAVGLVAWAKENPGLATFIGIAVSVLLGLTFNWVVKKIKRVLQRSRAKKMLRSQQAMRASTPAGSNSQPFKEERTPSPEQMQALRENSKSKYLAAIAKGYVDIDFVHNYPAYNNINIQFARIMFRIGGQSVCPEVMVDVPIYLFDVPESDTNFNVGDKKVLRLKFDNKLYSDSYLNSQLKSSCQFFEGFDKTLVTPRIFALISNDGTKRFLTRLNFVDGLDLYRGQTLDLNQK